MNWMLWRTTILTTLLTVLSGCQSSISTGRNPPPSAQLLRWLDDAGITRNDKRTVTDADEIERLRGFFPDLATTQQSSLHASWRPLIIIDFHDAAGKETYVASDYRIYRVGDGRRGDFVVRGDFADYINHFFGEPAGQ